MQFIFPLFDSKGWIIGQNGIILVTLDGGEHWQIQRNPTRWDNANLNETLYDICRGEGIATISYDA